MDLTIVLLAAVPVIAVLGGIVNRIFITHQGAGGVILRGKGIGWQFIRYCVLASGLPIVAILALKGMVTGEAAIAFIGAAVGYAFGKSDETAK